MVDYVKKATMEATCPGVYDQLPPLFRDKLAANAGASPQNAEIFRATFDVLPRLVDDLFARLKYEAGSTWPFWKLVAAFYLVESRIGPTSSRQSGERIYSTMPWPPQVKSIADALRFTEVAYFESHLKAPKEEVGCWRVEEESPTRIVLVDDTPYPCAVNEGVVAGICRAFHRQKPKYKILEAKRNGATLTRYEVTFNAP